MISPVTKPPRVAPGGGRAPARSPIHYIHRAEEDVAPFWAVLGLEELLSVERQPAGGVIA
jgi:hypothetical protein